MKSPKTLTLLPLLFLTLTLPSHARTVPSVEVPVRQVLFPQTGYEEGDEIQLLIQGELPDPCYELGRQSVSRDGSGAIIFHQYAWRHSTAVCDTGDLLGEAPYSMQSTLGRLKAGDYRVAFNPDGDSTDFRSLHIGAAASRAQPPNYALVTEVEVPLSTLEGQTAWVLLKGILSTPCSRWAEPAIHRQGDTLVISPIEIRPGTCTDLAVASEKRVALGVLPPGKYLLHVWSGERNALEKMLTVIRTHPSTQAAR